MWFGNTQTEIISKQIAENSTYGDEQTAFISTVISEFDKCPFRTYMNIADEYYKNNNDINKAERMVIGKDEGGNAILMKSNVLSNNKLVHNYFKKLTRQKIGYMLSKPFILAANKQDDELAKNMFEAMKEYFSKKFHKTLKNVARDSIIKGLGWLMVYYDDKGKLSFLRCAPEDVIPLWSDSDHTDLDAVIRKYTVESYEKGKKQLIKHVEYYTLEGVYHYVYNADGKLVREEGELEPTPNFTVRLNNNGVEEDAGVVWGVYRLYRLSTTRTNSLCSSELSR
jgi:SPP1 family phage portal protein